MFAGADEDLLFSRLLTEEQYLKKVPQIVADLYGPMAVPAARMLWNNAGPVFAMDAMTRAYGEIWALKDCIRKSNFTSTGSSPAAGRWMNSTR